MRVKALQGIATHIPEFLYDYWLTTNVKTGGALLNLAPGWDAYDLLRQIPENKEAGGSLNYREATIHIGGVSSVNSPTGIFTWHSHINDLCFFSPQDWCSFLLSESLWSLLLTPNYYRTYTKIEDQKNIRCEKYIRGYTQNKTPSVELMIRRFKKFIMSNIEPMSYEDMTQKALGQLVGIDVSPKIKP